MRPRAWGVTRSAGLVALGVVSLMPVLALVPAALSKPDALASALSLGNLRLLARSVDIALVVALIDVTLAAGAAAWAWAFAPKRARLLLVAATALLLVPSAGHAAVWGGVAGAMGRVGGSGGAAADSTVALALTVLAQASAFLPVPLLLAWVGLTAVRADVIEVARVCGSDSRALLRVAYPMAAPALAAGAVIVGLLSLGDYSVPSAFSVDTFSVEVFAEYAASGAQSALAMAWPLCALAALGVLSIVGPLSSLIDKATQGGRAWSTVARTAPWLAAFVWVCALLVTGVAALVVGGLLYETGGLASAAAAVTDAWPDISTSFLIAIATAILAVPIAFASAVPRAPRAAGSIAVLALATWALVVPPSVVGSGLIVMWNHDVTAAVYDGMVMPVLAASARFIPLAAVVVAAAAARLESAALEVSLVSSTPARALGRVIAPALAAATLAGAALVAALSTGELGATIMVLPPGASTATVRAYNLLHFGATPEVAAIALFVAVVGAAGISATVAVSARLTR